VSGRIESAPDVEPHLTLPPSAAERVTALEAERAREWAAIRDLEASLREVAANREDRNERGRFFAMIPLGFSFGLVTVVGLMWLWSVVGR
jgi:hypothetical protein